MPRGGRLRTGRALRIAPLGAVAQAPGGITGVSASAQSRQYHASRNCSPGEGGVLRTLMTAHRCERAPLRRRGHAESEARRSGAHSGPHARPRPVWTPPPWWRFVTRGRALVRGSAPRTLGLSRQIP
eukprot:133628-Prymnesium_polylepis.2